MLYRNNGDGTFQRCDQKAGLAGEPPGPLARLLAITTAMGCRIYVSRYVEYDLNDLPAFGSW